jgi:transcriptional regulator with XRE-family HTH domain
MSARNILVWELAERLGVSRQTVSSWRRGTSEPADLARMASLANVLQVSAGWLASGDGDRNPPTPTEAPPADSADDRIALSATASDIARTLDSAKLTLAEMRTATAAQEALVDRLQRQLLDQVIRDARRPD